MSAPPRTRFGAFEVDLRAGELYKHGVRLKLQDQPFQVLAVLLEHAGEVVTREELHQKLWPADTFIDFDTGLNSAVKKLRDVLADSAEEPRYIETLPRRGYRFIAHVANGDLAAPVPIEKHLGTVPPVGPKPELSNKRRILMATGVLIILVVVALVASQVFFARPAWTGNDVILLASFVNKTGDPIFDNSLDRALEVKLTESPFLSLLPEADVRASMRMMRHNVDERVTRDLGIEICKRRGLKALVVPEIATIGSAYVITLDAIDANSQKVIARQQLEATSKDQVIVALGKAGSKLRKRLGEGLSSLQKFDAPLDLATTSSLEALQAYSSGLTLYRSGKRPEAIPFFERAVELDPQFCSAYSMLGSAHYATGDGQASRGNFARAFELKDGRVTQEENFQTTAFYHSAITGNLEKETAVLVLYKQTYPRSALAHNLLGRDYALQGRIEEALQEFYWAMDDSPVPSASLYGNASQALMILGRFDEAKKLLEQWRKKGSPTSLQSVVRYRIAVIENDTSTMEQISRETPANDAWWLESQKQFAFHRGDFGELRSLIEALVKQHRQLKRMDNVGSEMAWQALFESYAGNSVLVGKLCRQAAEASRDSDWLASCALALAVAGDLTQAQALAQRTERLRPEDTLNQKVNLPLLGSIIKRTQGDAAKAVELLAPFSRYEENCWQIPYHRAKAYLAAGENDKAVAELEKLMGHRGWQNGEMIAPLAQLDLARAYAADGNREKSRKAYDDFFATWKQADPDIPILKQARAEYAKLQ